MNGRVTVASNTLQCFLRDATELRPFWNKFGVSSIISSPSSGERIVCITSEEASGIGVPTTRFNLIKHQYFVHQTAYFKHTRRRIEAFLEHTY
jgi:hypothetical protein